MTLLVLNASWLRLEMTWVCGDLARFDRGGTDFASLMKLTRGSFKTDEGFQFALPLNWGEIKPRWWASGISKY